MLCRLYARLFAQDPVNLGTLGGADSQLYQIVLKTPQSLGGCPVAQWWRLHLQCRRPGFDPWVGKIPGEGNGSPLQCSCLENPMDRRVWWAIVHGVSQSWTRLKQLSTRIRACIWQSLVVLNLVVKSSLCFG